MDESNRKVLYKDDLTIHILDAGTDIGRVEHREYRLGAFYIVLYHIPVTQTLLFAG